MSKISYTITDEKGNYVHRNSIRKINGKFHYLSYKCIKDGCIVYTNKERVNEALDMLELHNQLGKLGHKFIITTLAS